MSNLARYQLGDRLHEGRRHDIVRGTDPEGRAVVLKILKELHPSPAEVAKFRREYDVLASVQSSHVVAARAFETDRRRWALVQDDFGGFALSQQIDDPGLGLAARLDIAIATTQGLSDLHAHSLIHKDINPSNIVRNPDTGEVRLIDFGLATALASESPAFSNRNRLEGTLRYISPEQTGRVAANVDSRSDLYSLGVTLYELFSGRLPFESDDALELVHAHIAKAPRPLHEAAPSVPPVLSDVVMRLLKKGVDARYKSSHGLLADLERCRAGLRDDGAIEPFALGVDDVSDRLLIPPRLYGRDEVVARLITALDSAAETGAAAGVLVTGAAGLGKSAVVQALYEPLTERRGYFIAGKFEQFRRTPFSAVVAAFRSLVTELLGESEERLERLRNDLAAALGSNGRLITDVIPQVELITGPQPPVEELGAAETLNRFDTVFRNFVRVFARPQHPVVLLLDDLQWADAASLTLMRGLITDEQQSLLLLGAYRDNEVDAQHPLTAMLAKLAEDGTTLPTVALDPLSTDDVWQLVRDTTSASVIEAAGLAELVVRNTGGNPLFVQEFLKTLADEGLMRFDRAAGKWTWDLTEIRAKGFTQSVLDLMAARLGRLDDGTRATLQAAACAGATFDLAVVAALRDESIDELWAQLLPAVQDGLVAAASERSAECSFFHDRIQQAAYESMEPDERSRTHLAIGRLLRDADGADGFEVAFQLNQGRALIDDPAERQALAQLNHDAGRRANASTANAAAMGYFEVGLELLPEDAWESSYELALGLHRNAGETAWVLADLERSDVLIATAVEHARTALEKAELHLSVVLQHTKSARYPDALEAARVGLALLDYTMVEDDYMGAMMASFGELQELLGGKPAAAFLDRPEMTDPVVIGTARLLSRAMAAAFYVDPLLYSALGFEAMKLIARHGNPTDSLAVYAQYGHLLSAMFGDPPGGYDFTVLSRELCDRKGAIADKAQACFLSANWAHCWVRPMQTARPIVEEGVQAGLQSGEIQFAAYNMVYLGLNAFTLGEPLDRMLEDTEGHLAFFRRVKDKAAEDSTQSFRHAAQALAGNTTSPTDFSSDGLDEAGFLARAAANGAAMVMAFFHTFKAAVLNLYGDRASALVAAREAATVVAAIPGNITVGRLAFQTGLALTGVIPDAPDDERAALIEQLDAVLAQLAGYVVHCEANWAHPHALVVAEKARIDGNNAGAIEAYERAIQLSEEHDWPADHALACELAGRFWAGQGRDELSRGYLTQARYGYEQWEARAKVQLLDEEFGARLKEAREVRSSATLTSVSVTSTETSGGMLDLAAVIKASQAISGEIKLEALLGRLMELVLESAGAQHGVLVVVDEGELAVRAAAQLVADSAGEQTLQTDVELNVSLDSYEEIAAAVVHYAARTAEAVVLNDALGAGRFTKNPYIVRARPRSVLCLPLRIKGATVGLLYLENRGVTGAFTEDRLEVVNLLASQFSISFENARLYNEMEGKVARRTEQLATKNVELIETLDDLRVTQDKLVARTKFIRATFGRYVSDDVVEHLLEDPEALKLGGERRPITVLASDVRGFTSLAERLEPEEVLALLNRYFEVMFAVIHRHGGTINAILGDGLFVFFGAPIAQADAPGQAVRCALEMMLAMDALKTGGSQELGGLEMGIGVHTGAAVVGNIGSQARTKYSAIGLDVNLAARIEGCTVGGQILISEATAGAVPEGVFSGSMEFSAKGVAKPLTLFEVEGLGGETPLTYRRGRTTLTELSAPIPLRFQVVSGGVVAPTAHAGSFTKLAVDEAELASEASLAPLTDLKLQLLDAAGARIGGDLYAKVLGDEGGRIQIGFTSIPPDVREHIAALLG